MRSSVGRFASVVLAGLVLTGCQSGPSGGFAWNKWKLGGGGGNESAIANNPPSSSLPSQGVTPKNLTAAPHTEQYAATYGATPPGGTTTPGAYPSTSMPGSYPTTGGGGYPLAGNSPYNPLQTAAAPAVTMPNQPAGMAANQGAGTAAPGAMAAQTGMYNPSYTPPGGFGTPPGAPGAGGMHPSSRPSEAAHTSATSSPYDDRSPVSTADSRNFNAPSGDASALLGSRYADYPQYVNPQTNAYTPGASDYTPGATGYTQPQSDFTPGATGYTPGVTGYEPPARDSEIRQVEPPSGASFPSPPSYAPPSSDQLPPADNHTPYRPGSTSDFLPPGGSPVKPAGHQDDEASKDVMPAKFETSGPIDGSVTPPAVFVPPASGR